MRRLALVIGGWLLAAGVAVAVGLLAVSLLSSGLTSSPTQPLSKGGVTKALDKASAEPSAQPSQSASSGNERAGITKALHVPGGTLVARCEHKKAYLVSWTPGQGFETEEVRRGPAHTAFVKFESDNAEVEVTVGCRGGVPVSLASRHTED